MPILEPLEYDPTLGPRYLADPMYGVRREDRPSFVPAEEQENPKVWVLDDSGYFVAVPESEVSDR